MAGSLQRGDMRTAGRHYQRAFDVGETFRAHGTLPVNQLLRYGIVFRAGAVVFQALIVVHQTGSQHVGFTMIKIVEHALDGGVLRNHQLHAQIICEAFSQFIIEAQIAFRGVHKSQWRIERADAQFSTGFYLIQLVTFTSVPRHGRPQGQCQ